MSPPQGTSPQGNCSGSQAMSLHTEPRGAQMPQLGLQQKLPGGHGSPVAPQGGGSGQNGGTSTQAPSSSQKNGIGGITQPSSKGLQGEQGAPQGAPGQGS